MNETAGDDGDPTSSGPTVDAQRWSRLLSFLAVVGAALSTVASPDEAIEILLRHGLEGVEAAGAVVTVLHGRRLRIVGAAGYAQVATGQDRRNLDLDLEVPMVVAARDGTAVWVTDRADVEARFPAALTIVPDAQAFAAVPLVLDGTVIGSLGATFVSPREFGEIDRWFLQTLADFAARWLGAHVDASAPTPPLVLVDHDPDGLTEATTDFSARLALVAEALTADVPPFEVVEILVRQAMAAIGAEGGTVAMVESDQTLLPTVTVGYDRPRVLGHGRLTLDRVLPLTVAARRSEAVWVESFAEALRRFPALAEGPTSSQAWAAVPLLDNGRAFGVLGISFKEPHTFSGPERAFVKTLGHLAALRLRG